MLLFDPEACKGLRHAKSEQQKNINVQYIHAHTHIGAYRLKMRLE